MAKRAGEKLPPLIGNVKMVAATDDDNFFALLRERKFDIVSFAPGACRFSAARMAIPGGNASTRGWTLDQYKEKVREHQGQDVLIVETTEEREMVPLFRAALGLTPV